MKKILLIATKNKQKLFYSLLTVTYFLLLTVNINKIYFFIGDEGVYANSVESLMAGVINRNNHFLLAKTVWAFFVYLARGYFALNSGFVWRLGTIIFSLATLIVFYKIQRFFYKQNLALFGTIILALDPMYFAFSRILELDIISLFFNLSTLYFLLKHIKTKNKTALLYASTLAGLSLATKPTLFPVLLILPLYLFYVDKKKINIWIKKMVFYTGSLLVGFMLGNSIYFFIPHQISIIRYVFEIIASQLSHNITAFSYYQTSSPLSWFTIPQIMTLYRVVTLTEITEILVFQNPIFFVSTLLVLIISIYKVLKTKNKNVALIILFFLGQYLPWFLLKHQTFYYYIIPLIPLSILMFINLFKEFKRGVVIYSVVVSLSVVMFLFYFPLLAGLPVPKTYEKLLFSYSKYKYPPVNSLFCQSCSPR